MVLSLKMRVRKNCCVMESMIYFIIIAKNGEVDFMITYKGKVLPLEIKSGKSYEKHSALKNLLNNESYEIDEAFVFCNGNYKKQGKIHYFPVYMIDFVVK